MFYKFCMSGFSCFVGEKPEEISPQELVLPGAPRKCQQSPRPRVLQAPQQHTSQRGGHAALFRVLGEQAPSPSTQTQEGGRTRSPLASSSKGQGNFCLGGEGVGGQGLVSPVGEGSNGVLRVTKTDKGRAAHCWGRADGGGGCGEDTSP